MEVAQICRKNILKFHRFFSPQDSRMTSARSTNGRFLRACNLAVGVAVMMMASYRWANYLAQLHDNQFWFVNIKEVEREISFRTEQGLYYSYFKQLVQAESLAEGIEQLKRDNITEHLRTINIFYRFNIHQVSMESKL